MTGLYLDGVHDLTCKLEEYRVDDPTNSFSIKKDLWLRITIFVHTALTLLRTVVGQFFRGTGNIMAGIIHLDGERFIMGLNDYFSLLIQVIVLPAVGIVTFLLPKVGYRLLNNLRQVCDTSRQAADIVYFHEENIHEGFHVVRKSLSEAIMGVLGGFTAFMDAITLTTENALSLSMSEAYTTLRDTIPLIFRSPKDGLSCCGKESSRDIYAAHRIAMESFNPSVLE